MLLICCMDMPTSPPSTSKNICGFFTCLYFFREGALSANSFRTVAVLISPTSDIFAVFLGCGYKLISFSLCWASLGSFPHIICFSSWGSREAQEWICAVVPICLPEKRREGLPLGLPYLFPMGECRQHFSHLTTLTVLKNRGGNWC